MTEATGAGAPVSFASRLGYQMAILGVIVMLVAMIANRTEILSFDISVPAFGIGAPPYRHCHRGWPCSGSSAAGCHRR